MMGSRSHSAIWGLLGLCSIVSVLSVTLAWHRPGKKQERLRPTRRTDDTSAAQSFMAASALQEDLAQRDALIAALRREIDRVTSQMTPKTSELQLATAPEDILTLLTSRPDIDETPILDEETMKDLRRRRNLMPERLKDSALLGDDVDSFLQDTDWNPSGRELDLQERVLLSRLMRDYRFYARTSPGERLHYKVMPLAAAMREAGEYIEYPADSPAPRIQGERLMHAESTDDPNVKRLYVFWADQYPDMYRAHTVEGQRRLEAVVRAYELINTSGAEPAAEKDS